MGLARSFDALKDVCKQVKELCKVSLSHFYAFKICDYGQILSVDVNTDV